MSVWAGARDIADAAAVNRAITTAMVRNAASWADPVPEQIERPPAWLARLQRSQ